MIPVEVFEQAVYKLLAPVHPFLANERVTEIMINGPSEILVERGGRIERTEASFPSPHALRAALTAVAQYVGHPLDERRPILEARLPDGSRVEAIIPPAAPGGPYVSIRRFFRSTLTLERLIELDSLTPAGVSFLGAVVACKLNILVAGGTGSGKTSLLNALSGAIDGGERVVVIEDARELRLQRDHVVNLEARPPDARGQGAVSVRELFRATLRMRPDRIVVGEIRGAEALDLVQAMTSGHGGCLSTIHATYPRDALARLETLALMSDVALPLHALRAQIGSAVDVIVQTARLPDGSRKITHISEVALGDAGEPVATDVFVRSYRGRDSRGRVQSRLVATGFMPRCRELLNGLGHEVPDEVLQAARVVKP